MFKINYNNKSLNELSILQFKGAAILKQAALPPLNIAFIIP